jgi:hypothetical protein
LSTPATCPTCGQTFSPRFYCPDDKSPARHVFAPATLHVDNLGAVYAFCPEHTFTTYAMTAEYRPRMKRARLNGIARFFDSLAFRLALAVESFRLRFASRR